MKTVAHEIGHNFNLVHDGQDGDASHCGEDDGLMGYGTNVDKFSSCSIEAMQDWFQTRGDDMECLAYRSRQFVSNEDLISEQEVIRENDLASGCDDSSQTRKCVSIDNLDSIQRGDTIYDLNGIWEAVPDRCHEGESVYQLLNPTQATLYMYWVTPWHNTDKWFISKEIGGDDKIAFCENYWTWAGWRPKYVSVNQDISKCKDNVEVYTGNWLKNFAKDSSVSVSNGCEARVVTSDCFDDEQSYNDEICVFNNNTLWGDDGENYRGFTVRDRCSNGHKIFSYEHVSVEMNQTTTYHLHFDGDGNLTDGRWLVTKDNMLFTPETWCENQNLTECTEESWGYMKHEDDTISAVFDEHMRIYNMPCDQVGVYDEEPEEKNDEKTLDTASIVGTALAVVVTGFGIIGLFCWRSRRVQAKDAQMLEQEPMQTNIEVEVEVEVDVDVEEMIQTR